MGTSSATTAGTTTKPQNCRTMSNKQKTIIGNLGVLAQKKVHCHESWEEMADTLEHNEGVPKSEYNPFNRCIRSCAAKDVLKVKVKGFGTQTAIGRCKDEFEEKKANGNEGSVLACKQCVQHVPNSWNAKDTTIDIFDKVESAKQGLSIAKNMLPAFLGSEKKSSGLNIGGIDVNAVVGGLTGNKDGSLLDQGISLLGGVFGLGGGDASGGLSDGDQVCEGTHEAFDES